MSNCSPATSGFTTSAALSGEMLTISATHKAAITSSPRQSGTSSRCLRRIAAPRDMTSSSSLRGEAENRLQVFLIQCVKLAERPVFPGNVVAGRKDRCL